MIPFVDLKAQFASIKDDILNALNQVIDESAFIKGRFVERFEMEFANKCKVKHCIGVANGTDALFIVLKMLGIGEGDEVITTAMSWISTSETISLTGAKPVFVDVDDYFTIDADKIEAKITSRTKAIIPVHLYGQPADMKKIVGICDKHSLLMVEDCAQAHFATFDGKTVANFGVAGTFSFYPGKNLGAYGDAGAIVTNDNNLAEKFRMFANHGALKKHNHLMEGVNSRLDGMQAAILSVKLKHIDQWNKQRMENASYYFEKLQGMPYVKPPLVRGCVEHVFHVYCVLAEDRERLQLYLRSKGIETAIHYPTPLPFLPAYSRLGHVPHDFPVAYSRMGKLLSLPMYPELGKPDIEYITENICNFYKQHQW